MDEKETKPWERQKGETGAAYEAFTVFRNQGLRRSVGETIRILGKDRSTVFEWKSKWNWDERARAYDNSIEEEARQRVIEGRSDMIERHIQIAMKTQRKALTAMEEMPTKRLTAKDVKDYLKMSTDLERASRIYQAEEQEKNAKQSQKIDPLSAAFEQFKAGELEEDENEQKDELPE